MLYKCGKHPLAPAGWRCDACGATLCPQCTGARPTGGTQLEICMRCGGFARLLRVHRGELEPFGPGSLLAALRWPLSRGGLLTVAGWGLLVTLLGLLGGRGTVLATGLLLAWLFQIVRHTARGHDDLPGPDDFHNYLDDVVGPSLRLAAALVWIWLPALVFMLAHRPPPEVAAEEHRREVARALEPGGPGLRMRGVKVVGTGNGIEVIEGDANAPPPSPEQLERRRVEEEWRARAAAEKARAGAPAPAEAAGGEDDERADAAEGAPAGDADPSAAPVRASPPPRRDPWRWVPAALTVLGILLAPISLLASALKTPISVAANPIVLAGHAVRLGRDYLLLALFCTGAAALWLALRAAGSPPFASAPLPLLLATQLARVFLAFAAFRAIGLLVRARGSDLGYGSDEEYLVPALAGAAPAHRAGERAAEPGSAPRGAAHPTTASLSESASESVAESVSVSISGSGSESASASDLRAAAAVAPPAADEFAAAAAASLDLPAVASPLPGESPPQALARFLAARDLDACVQLLAAAGAALPHATAAAPTWMELARAALDRKQPKAAALAVRRCLESAPQGPLAAPAFLLAARVYDEQLADRATSNRLLAELLKRFPDSKEGQFAARRLAQLAGRNG